MVRRLLALIFAVGLCAGCKNRPAALDPFLGRTKVPPPATGAIGSQAPGAWNYPAAPPTLNTSNTGGSIYSQPGGSPLNSGGGVAPTSPFSTPAAPASGGSSSTPARFTGTSGAAPLSSNGGGSNGGAIRIVESPAGATSNPAARSGTFTGAASGGVDIMDLPASSRAAQPKTAEGTGRATPQSYEQPANGATSITSGIDLAAARSSTIPGQEPAYGFDAAYSQLNGRLEYSPADGRWQLRYVEPGVRPDQLGGLVVLAPTAPVAGFRNGDFVSVRGRVETSGGTSLPSYTATNVTPQRERR